MKFKEWLNLDEAVQIYHASAEDHEMASGAEYCMDDAGLRWTRDKELLMVAVDTDGQSEPDAGDVVGCVVYSWGEDHNSDDETWVYDFDVAVRRDYQAKLMLRVGPRLIDAALSHYNSLKAEAPGNSEIRVYAVNPSIVKFLTSPRYGFQIEDELQGGKAILVRR